MSEYLRICVSKDARKWADEILASCEMLSDVVRCQPSLAVANYERGFVWRVLEISLYLTVFCI